MPEVEELRELVSRLVKEGSGESPTEGLWREPLLVSAMVDDRFLELRQMAAPDHLMPWELLPGARSLIVFFLPFRLELARENRFGQEPARSWGVAYVETNSRIARVSQEISAFLERQGYGCAVTPPTHNFDPVRLVSRWSHKHLGFLAGLGRFGHNSQLITPRGCTGRLGSLVTQADLGDHPLDLGKEACLHKAGQPCLKCVDRCPVGALGHGGLDRQTCWARLRQNRESALSLAGLPETTHVCGKCVVMVPCSFHDPVSRLRSGSVNRPEPPP
jgi:epoxyqueuosine reductase